MDPTLRALSDLYTANLAEHGVGSRSVGWPDPGAHRLRFEKLAYLVEAARPGRPVSVNDWGCGYGALFAFLDARVELARYRGCDVSEAMVAAAREHVRDPRAAFACAAEPAEDADYGFASGIFNVRLDADEAAWAEHVRGALRTLHARSARGFAFNALSTRVDWRAEGLYYADPAEYLAFCQAELSPRVALLHDYPLYEWTMVVLRT